ncbi:uncharacterized protein LOC114391084 [Glycine soja]|uniref:uncharacterized protein n=1 Tax=Glycine max TaxID=3847 RepID=UPI00071926C7|nr:uncharacterized protein LOC102665355 [Glycine max]XP_028207874.1 uncharacterized protein LOC114391084 [Glycine soja]|eukprot:XP_014624096.1 uncharacterized protein LOC102665355 [Glycine max]
MATNSHFTAIFPILDGRNYDQWSRKMKAILGYQDVWDLVQNGLIPLPENANAAQQTVYRESKKKDWKGLCILHQCVNPAIFEKIARSETSKKAWDILANSYADDQKLKKVRLQTLRRQYELLGMEESESIATTVAIMNKEIIILKIIEEEEVEVLEEEGENLIRVIYSVITVGDMDILLMSATAMSMEMMLKWLKKRRRQRKLC